MIRVVYCFDGNLAKHSCVVVSSLLQSKRGKDIHYEIICICTKEAIWVKNLLNDIIQTADPQSKLTFISVQNAYDNAHETRGITSATYMRFMLPSLLPNMDKVIYMDVDFVVNGNLKELWDLDMDHTLFAGVKADVNIQSEWEWVSNHNRYWKMLENWKGRYINAGILIMNLDLIRKSHMVEIWDELVKEKFYYQDQDIINITCQGYKMEYDEEQGKIVCKSLIQWLPLKYNFMTFMNEVKLEKFVNEGIYTKEEVKEAAEEPIGIHYAGVKPWMDITVKFADVWWKYVLHNEELRKLFRKELEKCVVKVNNKANENLVFDHGKLHELNNLENRARRNNANFLLLNNWIRLIQSEKSIGKYIKKKGYKKLAIYGMHYIGERLYTELVSNGIQVAYGIDQNTVSLDFDLQVFHPDDKLPKTEAVIVTPIYWFDSIKEKMSKKIKCPIISLQDIVEELMEEI